MNAQWRVVGMDQHGGRQYKYLSSPDLKDTRKARKRASDEANRRWNKAGLVVRVTEVDCVG